MKINFLLLIIFVFSINLTFANSLDSIQETVPFDNPEYIGYRLAVTDLKVSPQKKGTVLVIEYTAINTGREDLLFGKNITLPPSLVFNFDQSIHSAGLWRYGDEIKDAIIKSNLSVTRGKLLKKQSISIPAKTEDFSSVPKGQEEIAVLENPRLVRSGENELKADVLVAKEGQEMEPVIDDFEASLNSRPQFDENACSDLEIVSIKILKKSKKKVTLEYTITNKGEGPANLIVDRKKEVKNMALQAHFSTGEQLTRGSFTFDGSFLNKGLEKSNGRLYPGESFTSTIKLNTQKMTSFTPYIILELDPYLAVKECDRKNNKGAIKVGEGRKE